MATRSHIGIQNKDGSIQYSYCHWDGYPSNNGKLLLENYNTEEKVRELLSYGSISSLDYNIEKTIFYSRDKGGDLICQTSFNKNVFNKDYGYLFYPEDNKWEYCQWNEKWSTLTEKICNNNE